jgi:hypothetical protein
MSGGWRQAALVVALLATLAAAWFAPAADDEVGNAPRSSRANSAQADDSGLAAAPKAAPRDRSTAAVPEVLLLNRRDDDLDRQPERLFVARAWLPKPAASAASGPLPPRPLAAASAPPPPPVQSAPPLPFRVLGRYSDGGDTGVFLQFNSQNLVARVGDTLVDQYKVEALSATTLTLRYLPLNETQTLDLGATN